MNIRLRVPLRLKSRQDIEREFVFGVELQPRIVPARTTLRIVEWFQDALLVMTPDGRHVRVRRETVRDHGYIPRKKRQP